MFRVLTSIKGAPAEYGMDAGQLKPFEKLLQILEGKLMEGKLFKVQNFSMSLKLSFYCTCIIVRLYIHVHNIYRPYARISLE